MAAPRSELPRTWLAQVVLYYQQTKMQKRLDTEREQKELAEMRAKLGIDTGDEGYNLAKR